MVFENIAKYFLCQADIGEYLFIFNMIKTWQKWPWEAFKCFSIIQGAEKWHKRPHIHGCLKIFKPYLGPGPPLLKSDDRKLIILVTTSAQKVRTMD